LSVVPLKGRIEGAPKGFLKRSFCKCRIPQVNFIMEERMRHYRVLLALLLPALLSLSAAAQQDTSKEDPVRTAVRSLSDALSEVKSDSQAVVLLENFLEDYPDTKYTSSVLDAVVYYERDEMGDGDMAIAIVKKHIPQIKDQENLKSSLVVLAGAYNAPRYKTELREQVKELEGYGPLSYQQYDALINAAFGAEDWDLALDLCTPAGDTATPEAVKADYPEAPEETIKERSEARAVDVDVYKGWGLANTGKVDQAISLFESSAGRVNFNYFGVPDNQLYLYWGQTLLKKGDKEKALEKLLPLALWDGDDDALKTVREIYEDNGGSAAAFDDYLLGERRRHARQMRTFSAVDYDDTMRESKDLMGKVTLVTFWFPT
jgi:tetratricopeptide (TPR) repeat protein